MRPNVDSTQLIPRPVWENPRVHLLDDIWLMTIVAILVATGVPWFASGFEVNVGMASWGLLALGGIHVAFTMLASPSRVHGRWRDRALTLLDILGVILIGFIWQHVGALQNPMFLIVFALPVVGRHLPVPLASLSHCRRQCHRGRRRCPEPGARSCVGMRAACSAPTSG